MLRRAWTSSGLKLLLLLRPRRGHGHHQHLHRRRFFGQQRSQRDDDGSRHPDSPRVFGKARACSQFAGCGSSARSLKVTVLNASQQTGRTLALCLKHSPVVDELAVFDSCAPAEETRALRRDLSLVTTSCRTFCQGAEDEGGLERALAHAKVVVVVSDPGSMALEQDARNLQLYLPWILAYCPKAFLALAMGDSTSSLVPMAFELYRKAGMIELAMGRLFGVTSFFSTRAEAYAAQVLGVGPDIVNVPVVGGADARTVVPLYSQAQPTGVFAPNQLARLQGAVNFGDGEEQPAGGACGPRKPEGPLAICAGYSAARFCNSLCKALRSETGVIECAYARSSVLGGEAKYFGAPLELGSCGIQRHLGLTSKLANSEVRALYRVLPEIKAAISRGECLADRYPEVCSPEAALTEEKPKRAEPNLEEPKQEPKLETEQKSREENATAEKGAMKETEPKST